VHNQTFYGIPFEQTLRPLAVEEAYAHLNGRLAKEEPHNYEIGSLYLIVSTYGSKNVDKFPFFPIDPTNVGVLVYNYKLITQSCKNTQKNRRIKVKYQDSVGGSTSSSRLGLAAADAYEVRLGCVGNVEVGFSFKKAQLLIAFLRTKTSTPVSRCSAHEGIQ
jgi:hypothetical protein